TLVWEQYDKAHSLHFALVISDSKGAIHSLTYSANASNVWGNQGYVDMGNSSGYNSWKLFIRNIHDDYRTEWGADPVLIKEIKVSHYLHDSWVGDKGGTVKNIAFDEEAPQTEIEVVPDFPDGDGQWYLSPPLITLTATDDTSGVDRIEYNLGSGWQVYVEPFLIEQNGEFTLRYQAIDKAGRVEVVKSRSFKIDTDSPQTSLSAFGPYYEDEGGRVYVSPQTEFELSAEDETSGVSETDYAYYIENQVSDVNVYTKPFSLESDDGRNTVSYQSIDNAGNVEEMESQEVYLDSTAPVSSDDSDGEWHNTDVTVAITAQDPVAPDGTPGSGVQGIVYGGTQEGAAIGNEAEITYAEEGTYELSYFAADNVENIESEKQAAPIKIDKTPPEVFGVPTSEPNDSGWYNENVIVHFEAADQEHLSGV
ncbi:MAG: Ig-like domain repeat protein, partial [Patescibacteria group bacterium]